MEVREVGPCLMAHAQPVLVSGRLGHGLLGLMDMRVQNAFQEPFTCMPSFVHNSMACIAS